MSKDVKVFIVDDSPTCRYTLRRVLNDDPSIHIVGEAGDGIEAIRAIPSAMPDLVLMDIVMPRMDGLQTLQELMEVSPLPVLVISDRIGGNLDMSFEALERGALEVIGKPSMAQLSDPGYRRALWRRIHLLAEIPVITRRRSRSSTVPAPRSAGRPGSGQVTLVCVGTSTGGPPALQLLMRSLPISMGWPMLIVQHMTPGFIGSMASWLQGSTGRSIEVAQDGIVPAPGTVYIAADGGHLELVESRLRITDSPPHGGHRPSVDTLLCSIASSSYASQTVGMVLTGMGRDGAAGLQQLRKAGGWTIAQDEMSSVVYGMPKAAVELEAACEVLSIGEIAEYLASIGTAS
jgi:two-component system chemotaxis response regulator CheB